MIKVKLETTLGPLLFQLYERKDEQETVVKHFLGLVTTEAIKTGEFIRVERDFAAQCSLKAVLGSNINMGFPTKPWNRHDEMGTVGVPVMANGILSSNFYITLKASIRYLDEKGWVIGKIILEESPGLESIEKVLVNRNYQPLANIGIKSAEILECPDEILRLLPTTKVGLGALDSMMEEDRVTEAIDERSRWEREQKLKLRLLGDQRAAKTDVHKVKTAFVARLNPLTHKDDLQLVFSRFGKVRICRINRRPQQSTAFGFVEFEQAKDCDEAVKRMDGVVLDDHRIRVDYAHSSLDEDKRQDIDRSRKHSPRHYRDR